jgi:GT2 family glycosyltransferase
MRDLRLLKLDANQGFAGPATTGVREAATPLVALVNNDCVLEPGYLAACAGVLASDPGLAAVQGVVLDGEGQAVDGCGVGWNVRGEAVPIGFLEAPPADDARPFAVTGVSATAAVYRRDLFLGSGGFPASYFAYYEDADLSLRLLRRGYRFACVPAARARHLGSATGRRDPARRWRRLIGNRLRTLRRNLERPPRGLLLPTSMRLAAAELGGARAMAMAMGALRDVRGTLREDEEARAEAPLLRALPA